MRRKQLAKSVAVAVLSATMALSTGVPAFAATVNSVKVDGNNVINSNSTAGKIADALAKVDTTSTGKWSNSTEKQQYIHEHFALALVDAGIFANPSAAYTAISVTDDNTCVVSLDGTQYTVSQTDGAATTTTYETTAKAAEKQADLDKKVKDALNSVNYSYSDSQTRTKEDNEHDAAAAAKTAIENAIGGTLASVSAAYTAETKDERGNVTAAAYYTFTLGNVTGGDYNGMTPSTGSDHFLLNNVDAALYAKAQTAVESALHAKYGTPYSFDSTVSAADIKEVAETALTDNDIKGVTVGDVDTSKSTDEKFNATFTLTAGSKSGTISVSGAVTTKALSSAVVSNAFNASNKDYTDAIKNNYTVNDSENLATGADKDGLATALTKVANKYLAKTDALGDSQATVEITDYSIDGGVDKATGYASGKVTVTRNGKTDGPKGFLIQANNTTGDLTYTSGTSLAKSDNQKLAEAVKALDAAVKKNADLKVTNTVSKKAAPTKDQIETQVKRAAASNVATVKSAKVVSYTEPTATADGTAVVKVTYTVADDADASKTVTANHDITLTFKALTARNTTQLSFNTTGISLWAGDKLQSNTNTLKSSDDLKNYVDANGNSALEWSSSDDSVATVDENGVVTAVAAGNATITATVKGNSKISSTIKVTVVSNSKFKDNSNPYSYYYHPVIWAATYGAYDTDTQSYPNAITVGVSADEFGVHNKVTRAQFVSFLYRLAGKPAVSGTTSFTDVDDDAYYADAVKWATKNGIVFGKSDSTFAPNATVTRAEAVSFLYRYAGKPEYNSSAVTAFSDVSTSAYYYDAVQWAAQTGVTSGKTTTSFAPNDTCDRAQGITFIYNAFEN